MLPSNLQNCYSSPISLVLDLQWHGDDGLGDRPDAVPTAKSISLEPSPGYAAIALVEAARQHAGHLTLVALGPLTNIALACKFAPDLPNLGKQGNA